MKHTILIRFSAVLLTGGILAACSATSSDDKTQQLAELKKQHAEIAKQIEALEKEIPADTSASLNVRAKEVSVVSVEVQPFEHYVQTQGLIEAEDNVLVSAKTPGVITRVYVSEGQQVRTGQILAQLDNAMILRNIEGLKAQVDLANTVYQRQKNLWDQKIGTEVQYLQAEANKENLEKQLASLEEQNDMTRIKAPFSGTVDEVMAKVGESAGPQAPAFRIVNTSDLKLTAHVSEAYVTTVKLGNKAIVRVPELNKELTARVTFVGRTIDPLSRTFNVEVKLNTFPELRPNMTGVVKIVYFTDAKAVVVPVNVVQTVNQQKIVYVAEAEGKNTVARKRVVEVHGIFDSKAQLRSGIMPGDRVITFGYQGLSDGQIIKL